MINIRKASCEDGQQISQLLINKYHFHSREQASDVFREECRNQHYRVVEEKGSIVGLISWRLQGTPDHGVAEVTRLAVDSEAETPQQIKEMLFDVMVAEADYFFKQHKSKLRKVYSLIHADNNQVKDFFLNKGMQQEAVLRNHFRQGTDELVFSLFFS